MHEIVKRVHDIRERGVHKKISGEIVCVVHEIVRGFCKINSVANGTERGGVCVIKMCGAHEIVRGVCKKN